MPKPRLVAGLRTERDVNERAGKVLENELAPQVELGPTIVRLSGEVLTVYLI